MTAQAQPTAQEDDGLDSVLGEDDEFQEAALFVQNNLSLFSRDELLYLYARFKQVRITVSYSTPTFFLLLQVTVGDVNIPRPGYFSFEAKAKWSVLSSKGEADRLHSRSLDPGMRGTTSNRPQGRKHRKTTSSE